jgi:cytochrome c553
MKTPLLAALAGRLLVAAPLFAVLPFAAPPFANRARAAGIEETAAVCSACHGENGVPVDKSIPVIWGQNEGYLYLELRDFKVGQRKNATMTQIAAGLEKPEMKQLAAYFAAKSWPDMNQPRAEAAMVQHAEVASNSAGCKGCHLESWQGDSVTPRVAGQSLPYLRETMAQFRSGERLNNPWMAALLKTYTDGDIDALAHYLAGQ